MNGMNFKPFIHKVLDTLSDAQIKTLADLIDSHSDDFENRSLITGNITVSDKGIGLYTIEMDPNTIRTGYLIYNDTYCVLLSYVSNSERIFEYKINVATMTYEVVKEYLTTDFLRQAVEIKAVSVGEMTEIEVDDINSADATAGQIIVADGEGGAEWVDNPEVLELIGLSGTLTAAELALVKRNNSVILVNPVRCYKDRQNQVVIVYKSQPWISSDTTYFYQIDIDPTTGEYTLTQNAIATGGSITVDSSLDATSLNPVQNKVITESFYTKAEINALFTAAGINIEE